MRTSLFIYIVGRYFKKPGGFFILFGHLKEIWYNKKKQKGSDDRMKRNFSLKFTLFDLMVGLVAFVMIISSLVVTNLVYAQKNDQSRIAEVYLDSQLLKEKSVRMDALTEEVTIVLKKEDYPDSSLLGDVEIHVDKEKGICVHQVTCPNLICKRMGWINKVGYNIVCVPNGFFVTIKTEKTDVDIPLG